LLNEFLRNGVPALAGVDPGAFSFSVNNMLAEDMPSGYWFLCSTPMITPEQLLASIFRLPVLPNNAAHKIDYVALPEQCGSKAHPQTRRA